MTKTTEQNFKGEITINVGEDVSDTLKLGTLEFDITVTTKQDDD